MMRRAYTVLLLSVAGFQAIAAGDQWPEYRGPAGNGHSEGPGVPLKWSETENIAWKTPIHGRSFSSPVIWDEQVWMTTATEDGTELFAICVDAGTGEVLVDRKIFDVAAPPAIAQFNSFSSPTPAIEAGRVYLSWGSFGLACLDTDTKDVLWTRRDLECDHYRGPGSSPVIFEDLLIQHYDGYDVQYVVALNK